MNRPDKNLTWRFSPTPELARVFVGLFALLTSTDLRAEVPLPTAQIATQSNIDPAAIISDTPLRFCAALYFAAEYPFERYGASPHYSEDATGKNFVDRRRFSIRMATDLEAPAGYNHREGRGYVITHSHEFLKEIDRNILNGYDLETCTTKLCDPFAGFYALEFQSCNALTDSLGFGHWMDTRTNYNDWPPQ